MRVPRMPSFLSSLGVCTRACARACFSPLGQRVRRIPCAERKDALAPKREKKALVVPKVIHSFSRVSLRAHHSTLPMGKKKASTEIHPVLPGDATLKKKRKKGHHTFGYWSKKKQIKFQRSENPVVPRAVTERMLRACVKEHAEAMGFKVPLRLGTGVLETSRHLLEDIGLRTLRNGGVLRKRTGRPFLQGHHVIDAHEIFQTTVRSRL